MRQQSQFSLGGIRHLFGCWSTTSSVMHKRLVSASPDTPGPAHLSATSVECLVVLFLISLMGGCQTVSDPGVVGSDSIATISEPVRAVPVTLDQSTGGTTAPLLNVSIALFENRSNAATQSEARLIEAEKHYFSMQLKEVLDQSGYWGAVRVVPSAESTAELGCEGHIKDAHAARLHLQIRCVDASGEIWFDESMRHEAEASDYLDDALAKTDPFSPLFFRVANALSERLKRQSSGVLIDLQAVALMRYGVELAPATFLSYIGSTEDRYVLLGYPAEDDPMLRRIERIRDSEFSFVDAVDEAYAEIMQKMVGPYHIWRQYQFEFEDYNQALGATDRVGRQQLAFDYEALLRAYRRYQDFRQNQDELEEMADSLNRSLAPTLAEVEGRVVELSGSLSDQYRMWRSVLRNLYLEESGADSD